MYKIVFMRHGESTWNLENRFTGWTDVDLTEKGINEARTAGRVLREAGVIRQHYQGTAIMNVLRVDDLEARFPGLQEAIFTAERAARSSMAGESERGA